MDSQKEFVLRLNRALQRVQANHPTVVWELDIGATVDVIAHLQLALRHPGAKSGSSQRVRKMVNDLLDRIAAVDSEAGMLLRLGDDPSMDIPRGET